MNAVPRTCCRHQGLIVAILLAASVTAPADQSLLTPSSRATTRRGGEARLAVIGFASPRDADERDVWLPVAFEELLVRRLRHVPGVRVAPTMRLYQGRSELHDPRRDPPPWPVVIRGLGLDYWVSGSCRGPEFAVEVELTLRRLCTPQQLTSGTTLPPGRLFDNLDAATRWILEELGVGDLPAALTERVFGKPCRSPTAIEYYARALMAARANKTEDALRYASQCVASDPLFRPGLAMLAQTEVPLGPSGRGSAARRLRALSELAAREGDMLDRARAEIGLSLISQSEGAFEAACKRAENALCWSFEQDDLYGQMAALTALADAHLTRPLPLAPALPPEARERFIRQNMRVAADWQEVLVDLLYEMEDRIGALPAVNKLALIYERLGEGEAALRMHERTLTLATELDSPRHQATAWLYLGQWYRDRQRWQEALDATARCLALADDDAKAAVRIVLGSVYQSMGRHEESLGQFELAYEQARRNEDLLNQYTCLREIAAVRLKLGQRDLAISALQEAIDLAHVLELREEQRLRQDLEKWKSGGG